eukprot:121229-Pleurochrysis_carterae.AAC.1
MELGPQPIEPTSRSSSARRVAAATARAAPTASWQTVSSRGYSCSRRAEQRELILNPNLNLILTLNLNLNLNVQTYEPKHGNLNFNLT